MLMDDKEDAVEALRAAHLRVRERCPCCVFKKIVGSSGGDPPLQILCTASDIVCKQYYVCTILECKCKCSAARYIMIVTAGSKAAGCGNSICMYMLYNAQSFRISQCSTVHAVRKSTSMTLALATTHCLNCNKIRPLFFF